MPTGGISIKLTLPRLLAGAAALLLASTIAADELPGAAALSDTAQQSIKAALAQKTGSYAPRTKHRLPDGTPRYTNRLITTSSPYLLQHAHNPVNWYPWGDAAFDAARAANKPVLLSVGYSTCHWCHVMEDESFDNVEIATYLNRHYVAIKVDREERPDIDAVYMAAVQALTGRGGWPMTVWLTPDRQPFYGGTYFPPYDGDRGVSEGFLTLLGSLGTIFANNREGIGQASERLMQAVAARMIPPPGDTVPDEAAFAAAFTALRSSYDPVNGGIRSAQKFPSHMPIRFLLRYYRRSGDDTALAMAEKTLRAMASGGLYDHVGGGIHRYTTDAEWRIPHFEKMLYDNALLAIAFLEAYQLTGNADYAAVCRDILRYASRDMRSTGAAFDTATDADSQAPGGENREGWFYTWPMDDIEAAAPRGHVDIVKAWFDISEAGDLDGRNVLRTPADPAAFAARHELDESELAHVVATARDELYRRRLERPAPFRDDKILTAWNGLMISAFARAAVTLGDDGYRDIASQAARFVLENLYENGTLRRTYRDGQSSGDAFADDYAFFIQALLDLFEASGDVNWFEHAIRLDDTLHALYEDTDSGGFFFTGADGESMLTREKPGYDASTPSANAVSASNLLRLYEFTSDDDYRRRAADTLQFFGAALERSPAAMAEMLRALDFYHDEAKEIVIVTANRRAEAKPFLDVLSRTFMPNHVLIVVNDGEELEQQLPFIPLLEGKRAIRKETTAFVCEQGICELPTADPAVFAALLGAGES